SRLQFLRVPLANKSGKPAIIAEGIRMVAEIADDLNEALLRGCARQARRGSPAEQTLARQPEHRVVLRRRPREVALLQKVFQLIILAFGSANPKPGKNDIHPEISGTGL